MGVQIHSADTHLEERDWRQAITRGLRGRCPHCGQGRLFRAFLKPVDICEACGEDLHHQRADDLPPYIVITIVGHIVVGGYMMTDLVSSLTTWQHLAIWTPITLILSLLLLQPVKGGTIGLQWALRMHGFDAKPAETEATPAYGDRTA